MTMVKTLPVILLIWHHKITPTYAVLVFHTVVFLRSLHAVSESRDNPPIIKASVLISRYRHNLTFG